ncbi:MAG: hypothetical protein K2I79_04030, partial [Clostridia bacterium]|nr:hypothetical protein [Clostridia bacterium]
MEGIVDSERRRIFILKSALFSLINLLAFLFFVVYASIRSSNTASSVFAAVSYAVILLDLLVYACADYKGGYIMIAVTAALFIVNVAGSLLIGLSVFSNSMSIVGIIALVAKPVAAMVYTALCVFGKVGEGKWLTGNVLVKRIIVGACIAALLAFIIVAIITFNCSTPINTNVPNLITLFILLSFTATAVIIRIVRLDCTVVPISYKFLTLVIALLIAVTAQYTAIDAVAYKDDNANRAAFVNAFGEESLELKGGRGSAYSFADVFIGMATNNYSVERDVVYYKGEGERQGVTLRYDMYYPTYEGAHKRVLLYLHGSGGDKDIGNFAHRNKYFASRGYVVYDLQYGDFNERNTGFKSELYGIDSFLYYIDSFVTDTTDN